MYTQSLCDETIYKLMSTFDNQSMSIGCVIKFGHLSGFLRHYLLSLTSAFRTILYSFDPSSANGMLTFLCITLTHVYLLVCRPN